MKISPGKAGRVRYDWWRAHHGLPSHSKWRGVARAAQVPVSAAFHIVVCLLDTASRGKPRGSIGDFKPFDCAGIVDVPVDKVDRVVEVLREIGWIEGSVITEWDARQPQREDASAARRAAEYRSRIQSVTNGIVTQPARDNTDRHVSDALQTQLSRQQTHQIENKDIGSSEFRAARAMPVATQPQEDDSAGELATALRGGALTRPPDSGPAATQASKPPSEVTRDDWETIFAAKRATEGRPE